MQPSSNRQEAACKLHRWHQTSMTCRKVRQRARSMSCQKMAENDTGEWIIVSPPISFDLHLMLRLSTTECKFSNRLSQSNGGKRNTYRRYIEEAPYRLWMPRYPGKSPMIKYSRKVLNLEHIGICKECYSPTSKGWRTLTRLQGMNSKCTIWYKKQNDARTFHLTSLDDTW